MRRRSFLGAAGAAVALLGSRRLVFAAPCEKDCSEGGALVATAFRRAERSKRPLLVIVIPAEDGKKYAWGQSWGELLNFGSDEQLAPLGLVEVVCATMADVRRIVPAAGEGEPRAIWIETGALPARVRRIDVTLPDLAVRRGGDPGEGAVVDRRIALLSGALRKAAPELDRRRIADLAREARERVVKQAPAGARWAHDSGCATNVEGEPPESAKCGMGHVPQKSQRFLYFFTKRA